MKIGSGHIGIVLKNFAPKSSKIALLDKRLGRVDGVVLVRDICVGSLLHYDVRRGSSMYMLEHVKVDDLPLSLARIDLLFLHHVFELCYYSIPIGGCMAGIFELLQFLYTVDYSTCSAHFKKLFVLRLLATIGMHPEVSELHEQIIEQLLALPIDILTHELLDDAREKVVDDWLYRSVAGHPYVEQFKTMHFLNTNRSQ